MLRFMGREDEEVAKESSNEAERLLTSHRSGGGAQVAHLRQLAIDGEARSSSQAAAELTGAGARARQLGSGFTPSGRSALARRRAGAPFDCDCAAAAA